MANPFPILFCSSALVMLVGCDWKQKSENNNSSSDTGMAEEETEAISDCERLSLPVRDFDPEESMVPLAQSCGRLHRTLLMAPNGL